MFRAMVNLLYPVICRGCFKKIDGLDQNICGDCLKKIKNRMPPFCIKCGKQLKGGPELKAACQDCKDENPYFDKAWSACYYEGVLKNLIHDFKYKKITSLSSDFAAMMSDFMKQYNAGLNCELILPVPMHPNRLIKREINHAGILAKELGRKLNMQYSGNALKKIKDTPAQSALNRNARIKNLRSSFFIKDSSVVKGKQIMLVDDLFTTGSTVNECSRILKDSGARYIEVVTLARGDIS